MYVGMRNRFTWETAARVILERVRRPVINEFIGRLNASVEILARVRQGNSTSAAPRSRCGGFLLRDRLLKLPDEQESGRHVIEDEKTFLAIQKHVIVSEAPVISLVVECVENGDRSLQDHLGHPELDKLELLETLHVHTENGVQGLVPIDGHPAPLGNSADEFRR